MVRPLKCRRVACDVPARYFKPQGIPLCALEEIELALDEVEAMRLTDVDGLYQADAAERMGVSRQTLGAIVARALGIPALVGAGSAVLLLAGCAPAQSSAAAFAGQTS